VEGLERGGISDGEVREEVGSRQFEVESKGGRTQCASANPRKKPLDPAVSSADLATDSQKLVGGGVEIVVGGIGGF
jgi:hypothetical protein